jgi:hypothetical protein
MSQAIPDPDRGHNKGRRNLRLVRHDGDSDQFVVEYELRLPPIPTDHRVILRGYIPGSDVPDGWLLMGPGNDEALMVVGRVVSDLSRPPSAGPGRRGE